MRFLVFVGLVGVVVSSVQGVPAVSNNEGARNSNNQFSFEARNLYISYKRIYLCLKISANCIYFSEFITTESVESWRSGHSD